MGMIRRAIERFNRRRHQRGVAKHLAKFRKHLLALGYLDSTSGVAVQVDPDMASIDMTERGRQKTMWVN